MAAVPEGVALRDVDHAGLARDGLSGTMRGLQSIRPFALARPAGLGTVAEQDVAGDPTLPLFEVMRLASDRDLVARQYANGYADVLNNALPALTRLLAEGHGLETAIVGAFLTLLASHTDSLIERKQGHEPALEALRRAHRVLASGWPHGRREARRGMASWTRGCVRTGTAATLGRRPTAWPPPSSPRTLMGQTPTRGRAAPSAGRMWNEKPGRESAHRGGGVRSSWPARVTKFG